MFNPKEAEEFLWGGGGMFGPSPLNEWNATGASDRGASIYDPLLSEIPSEYDDDIPELGATSSSNATQGSLFRLQEPSLGRAGAGHRILDVTLSVDPSLILEVGSTERATGWFGLDAGNMGSRGEATSSSGPVAANSVTGYFKPELTGQALPFTITPGTRTTVSGADGFSIPSVVPGNVYKVVNGCTAQVDANGAVDTTCDGLWSTLKQTFGGGWEDQDFLRERHSEGDHGWDELFKTLGIE